MTTITQTITALPTAPDPATMTPAQFSTAAAASVLAQKAMTPELNTWAGQVNTVAGEVQANADLAEDDAAAAAASESAAAASATAAGLIAGALAWVNGGTYALYAAAISTLNFQTYRKITASSVTVTDPMNDATNWTPLAPDPTTNAQVAYAINTALRAAAYLP